MNTLGALEADRGIEPRIAEIAAPCLATWRISQPTVSRQRQRMDPWRSRGESNSQHRARRMRSLSRRVGVPHAQRLRAPRGRIELAATEIRALGARSTGRGKR